MYLFLPYLTGSIFVGSQPERTPSILFCRSLLFSCHRLRDPYLRLVYQQMFCAGHLHSFCRVLVAKREHCEWALSLLCDSDHAPANRSLRSLMTVEIAGRSLYRTTFLTFCCQLMFRACRRRRVQHPSYPVSSQGFCTARRDIHFLRLQLP